MLGETELAEPAGRDARRRSAHPIIDGGCEAQAGQELGGGAPTPAARVAATCPSANRTANPVRCSTHQRTWSHDHPRRGNRTNIAVAAVVTASNARWVTVLRE
ncbi:MAG: hypothetical protein HYW52_04495 [Gemmatimonadetes bacterium]|nr:hypothetical protein [Gemmatimonadota bacterium]